MANKIGEYMEEINGIKFIKGGVPNKSIKLEDGRI